VSRTLGDVAAQAGTVGLEFAPVRLQPHNRSVTSTPVQVTPRSRRAAIGQGSAAGVSWAPQTPPSPASPSPITCSPGRGMPSSAYGRIARPAFPVPSRAPGEDCPSSIPARVSVLIPPAEGRAFLREPGTVRPRGYVSGQGQDPKGD
jgi:hypothetical protein